MIRVIGFYNTCSGKENSFFYFSTCPTRISHGRSSIPSAAGGSSWAEPRKSTTATRPSCGAESTSSHSNTAPEPASMAGRRWNLRRTWGTYRVWLFTFWLVFPYPCFTHYMCFICYLLTSRIFPVQAWCMYVSKVRVSFHRSWNVGKAWMRFLTSFSGRMIS